MRDQERSPALSDERYVENRKALADGRDLLEALAVLGRKEQELRRIHAERVANVRGMNAHLTDRLEIVERQLADWKQQAKVNADAIFVESEWRQQAERQLAEKDEALRRTGRKLIEYKATYCEHGPMSRLLEHHLAQEDPHWTDWWDEEHWAQYHQAAEDPELQAELSEALRAEPAKEEA